MITIMRRTYHQNFLSFQFLFIIVLTNPRNKKEAKFYGYNWVNKGIQFVNSYHPSYGGFEDNGHLKAALDKAFQEASKGTNG